MTYKEIKKELKEITTLPDDFSDAWAKEERIKKLCVEAKKLPKNNQKNLELCEKLNKEKLKNRKAIKVELSKLKPIAMPFDTSETETLCSNKDPYIHLRNIFYCLRLLNFEELEQEANKYIYSLDNFFLTEIRNADGRLCMISPTDIKSEDISNKTENFIKLEKYLIYRNSKINGLVLRGLIYEWGHEHKNAIDVIIKIVNNSKMISDENKEDVIKMFKYGLIECDLVTALQKLVPIVENTTKYICTSNGIDPYRLKIKGGKSKMIDETNMFSFLWKQNIFKEKFSEDIVFNFKNLFDSSDCLNMRTDIAHGQISSPEYNNPSYFYVLVCFLYLIFIYQ